MHIPMIDEEYNTPMAVPMVQKHNASFSISIAVKEVFIVIGVFNTIRTLIVEPNFENLVHDPNFGNIMFMIMIIVVSLIILYAPISQLTSKEPVIPIYSSDTLTEAGMVNNILSGFKNKPDRKWCHRIFENFKNPSWTSDVIVVFNNITMTFYETTRIILDKLHQITNDVELMHMTLTTIRSNQIVFDRKLDDLKATQEDLKATQAEMKISIDYLKTSQEELKNEMRVGFKEIKMLFRSRFDDSYVVM